MERLDRYAPPGMGTTRIRWWTLGTIAFSAMFSLVFLIEYFSELHELRREMENPVYHGMTMTPFADLIVFPMILFRMAPVIPLLHILTQYAYFFQETKSIYLMKRLRSSKEMVIRCLVLPVAGMLLVMAAGCAVYWLYYWIYYTCTPEILLPANL